MRKIIHSNRGVSAVEFALVLPLLLVILFGIIEFSAILYNQAVITNASREAARYAAGFYTNPVTATLGRPDCSDLQNYVVTYVQKHFISFKDSTFNSSNVECCADTTCSGSTTPYHLFTDTGYVDTVRISYQYNFLVLGGFIDLITAGTWPDHLILRAQTVMRDENQTTTP